MTQIFPAVFRIEGGDTSQAERQTLAGIDRITSGGRRKLGQFSTDAQRLLDQALTAERTSRGSLDLGVDELRTAALAQEQRAFAAREVADATLRAAQTEGLFNQEMRETVAAARQYAAVQDELAGSLQNQVSIQSAIQRELGETATATNALTQAQNRRTVSTGAARTASVQAGQQLQDVVVQLEAGTRATTVFSQQVPQLAFALSGLEGSANKTQARIGSFATFLAGPWGAAIFAATAVLGPFVARLFESEEAADQARLATDAFSSAQSALGGVVDLTTGAIREQSDALVALARAQAIAGQIEARRERADALSRIDELNQEGDIQLGVAAAGGTGFPLIAPDPRRDADDLDRVLAGVASGSLGFDAAIKQVQTLGETGEFAEQAILDASTAIANFGVAGANEQAFTEALSALDGDREALSGFLKPAKGSTKRKGNGAAQLKKEAAEARRLAEFALQASDRIETVQASFAEVPSEVGRVNRAVATLDGLMADIAERKPEGFAELLEDARAARDEIADFALGDLLKAELGAIQSGMEAQLQTQRLALAGRQDEIEALRILEVLQGKYGSVTEETADAVRDMTAGYLDAEAGLQRLSDQQAAFLDATQSIRSELEGLFAGEGADFREIFNRLQAQFTVEKIFGDSLRELEGGVRSRFEEAAETLADNQLRASSSFQQIAESAEAAALRLAGVATPQSFAAAFAPFAQPQSGNSILTNSGDTKNIIVEATKDANKGTVNALDPKSFADMAANALTQPLIDQLPPEIATQLSPVLNSALVGLTIAGPAGGVLGGLDGLFGEGGTLAKNVSADFSKGISAAFAGLETSLVTGNLLQSFGVGGSQTGGTVGGVAGGALGAVIGGPAGAQIGSAIGSTLGNILGGLLGGTKRGSATIGGNGSNLAVTGTRGNSSSREDAGSDLADNAILALERVAEQLGATLDASAGAVSLGVRGDNIRVDPTGQGITKTRNGAVNFGEDAEAAIAFAVQDLISDGVIQGLSQSEQALLNAASDINKGIQDVLSFQGVFDRLDGFDDSVGAEIRALNTEFEGLIELFERASASASEFADLERVYDLERAALIEQATDNVAGSLQDLIDDLTIGDSGFSLRTRRENALTEFTGLESRVAAGDTTAIDDFEDAARALIDIERQIFGSQQPYFDRVEQVLALSQSVIADQASAFVDGSDVGSPFDTGSAPSTDPIGVPIAQQTDILAGWLEALNVNANGSLQAVAETNRRLEQIGQQLRRPGSFGPQQLIPSSFSL